MGYSNKFKILTLVMFTKPILFSINAIQYCNKKL
nr:MAG TPA: hypothetical protein [Caudoviricetes sp.]